LSEARCGKRSEESRGEKGVLTGTPFLLLALELRE
jgi:hypothetical protein